MPGALAQHNNGQSTVKKSNRIKNIGGLSMKRSLYLVFSAVIVLSMILGACQTTAPATEAPAPEKTEAPAEPTKAPEPTEAAPEPEPMPEPAMATPEDLDAAYGPVMDNMVAYNTIKADALLEKMVEDAPPFILDVRTTAEVEEQGHIDGAVHIPLAELTQHLELLPTFDIPIVAYCGSGWRATIAMTALSGMGWQDVKALKALYSDWKEAGNPVVEGLPADPIVLDVAQPDPAVVAAVESMLAVYGSKPFGVIDAEGFNTALAENPDLVVIDSRTPGELEEKGTIDTGDAALIPIPLEQFVAERAMWPADLDTEIVVYCGSGHRSTMALAILGSYGYTSVSSLKGGFGGWASAGYPVAGGAMAAEAVLDAAFGSVVDNMVAYNTIKADALLAAMVEDTPPFLLDVRSTGELEEQGHIDGAVHVPLAELTQHLDLLPAFDVPIVVYCGSGWRATIAMTALSGMGWTDVKALKALYSEWKEAGNPVVEGLPADPIVLDIAQPDPVVVAAVESMLAVYGSKPYGVIDAEGLTTALAEKPDLVVIDSRTAGELADKGVIDTGGEPPIHIALEDFINSKDMWPADKAAEIVVYCGSGHRSTMALAILGSYGYTNVSSLKGGFGGWAAAEYPVAAYASKLDAAVQNMLSNMVGYNTIKADALLTAMVEDTPPFILDVRSTAEVEEQGHIDGAVHVPLNELMQHIELYPAFDVTIVVYCGSGWRATIAMTALSVSGWQDVKALKALYSEWKEAGNPVVEGPPADPIVLDVAQPDADLVALFDALLSEKGVKPYGVITVDDLNTALVEMPELALIDARTAGELAEKGVIDTGGEPPVHIALEEFIAQMADWPADKDGKVVVYCGSGHRSTIAMTILWAYGYSDVSSMKGGFTAWVEAGYPVAEFVAQ